MKYGASAAISFASGSFSEATSRRMPSAPRPACRSQSARTMAGVRSMAPSRSGRTRKSFSVPCPFTNLIAPSPTSWAQRTERGVQHPRIGRVEPVDTGVAAEPGPLAADEAPGRPDGLGHRLVQIPADGAVVVQALEQLRVAQCLARRRAVPE